MLLLNDERSEFMSNQLLQETRADSTENCGMPQSVWKK